MALKDLLRFENDAWQQGYTAVAGMDEAGRGPIAGPVTAAAVILPREKQVEGLNDSKLLTPSVREKLAEILQNSSDVVSAVESVSPAEIDQLNILQATYLAMTRALNALTTTPDFVLVDGNSVPRIKTAAKAVVKGDSRSANIAAASILAKVTRDRIMEKAAADFPGYGFEKHKGYATSDHIAALEQLGPCSLHRKSFTPVSRIINHNLYQPELFPSENGYIAKKSC